MNIGGAAVPLGSFSFVPLVGKEILSEIFSYTIQLKTPDSLNLGYISPAANLPLKPMVGKDITVDIKMGNGKINYLSGLLLPQERMLCQRF